MQRFPLPRGLRPTVRVSADRLHWTVSMRPTLGERRRFVTKSLRNAWLVVLYAVIVPSLLHTILLMMFNGPANQLGGLLNPALLLWLLGSAIGLPLPPAPPAGVPFPWQQLGAWVWNLVAADNPLWSLSQVLRIALIVCIPLWLLCPGRTVRIRIPDRNRRGRVWCLWRSVPFDGDDSVAVRSQSLAENREEQAIVAQYGPGGARSRTLTHVRNSAGRNYAAEFVSALRIALSRGEA